MGLKEGKPGGQEIRPDPAAEHELLAWALLRAPDRMVGRYLRAGPGKRKDKHRATLIQWARRCWQA